MLSLEELHEQLGRDLTTADEEAEGMVVLDEALDELTADRPRADRVVECRFFSEMKIEQTAEALGVSPSTVSRDWKLAQGWM